MQEAEDIIRRWQEQGNVREPLNLICLELREMPDIPENVLSLYLSHNYLTRIDRLPPYLEKLDCDDNYLTYICELPSTLTFFSVEKNWLEELPHIPDSVWYMAISYNYLTRLPNIPPALEAIFYHHTLITEPFMDDIDYTDLMNSYHVDKIESLREFMRHQNS